MCRTIRFLFVVFVAHVAAATLQARDMQQLIDALDVDIPQLMQAAHVPGLSMVLIRNNPTIWRGTYGVRGAGEPEKVDEQTIWGAVHRTIRYDYRLMNPTSKPATKIRVNVPLPLESPRQKIHYLHLPDRGQHRTFTDEHGQKIVQYTIDRLAPGKWVDLGYVVGIALSNMRWNAAGQSENQELPVLSPAQRQRYLKAETNYSMDTDVMRAAAKSLVQGASTDFEKLVRIHDYVISKIRYVRDSKWDPAATVLSRGSGSCSEYNYVLSGLCRLAGLPTRCVGATTNGFRDLPTTDAVFHRWTEVFLAGYGWFPADCSRDANPIRGKRSHFGRVYTDVMVWCRQAGGRNDTLGWDYRAKAHVTGDDPGVRESHRTRWFEFHSEPEVEAAYQWLLDGSGARPGADLLECALLRWREAGADDRARLVQALAAAGRNVCLRYVATMPEAGKVRAAWARKLCTSKEVADTLLVKSRNLYAFRNWFKSNESRLVPAGNGQFQLASSARSMKTRITTATSAKIWRDLVPSVVDHLRESLDAIEKRLHGSGGSPNRPARRDDPGYLEKSSGVGNNAPPQPARHLKAAKRAKAIVMPVTDQTLAGLGGQSVAIHTALKKRIAQETSFRLVDENRFDHWMSTKGPGSGEYWILANARDPGLPAELMPDVILVPVCITSRVGPTVLFHLEVKVLDLHSCQYTKAISRVYRKPKKVSNRPPSGRGVLVAGGDTVLARWEHDMVSRNTCDWPLTGVKRVLSAADAALCNLECCVSARGTPVDKGERCSFYYRARPEMLQCLTRAGVDIVNAANNHGGDYGPLSVADTAKWCRQAGLVCVGNGRDSKSAEQPRLVHVGTLRVGFAGMDATTACFRAETDRPGTSYAPEDADLKIFSEKMEWLGHWADGRCDLLILTIHWGNNWVKQTQPSHRAMARVAFQHGVDLILGHSAHRLQGMEVIDGKVVVYDMGNLLFDCQLKPEGCRSALFRIHMSTDGVRAIEVLPTQVLNGHTVLARAEAAGETLDEMCELCANLGTRLSIDEDLEGRPVGLLRISNPKRTDHGVPDRDLACATLPLDGAGIPPTVPAEAIAKRIPQDACRMKSPAELAPGVVLAAYRLPGEVEEGGILHLATWWRVTKPVAPNTMLAFELSPEGALPRRGTPWYTRHDAGDWRVPLTRLEPGTMVVDRYPARLAGIPAGPLKVRAVMLDTTRPEGNRVLGQSRVLGTVTIRPRMETLRSSQ